MHFKKPHLKKLKKKNNIPIQIFKLGLRSACQKYFQIRGLHFKYITMLLNVSKCF